MSNTNKPETHDLAIIDDVVKVQAETEELEDRLNINIKLSFIDIETIYNKLDADIAQFGEKVAAASNNINDKQNKEIEKDYRSLDKRTVTTFKHTPTESYRKYLKTLSSIMLQLNNYLNDVVSQMSKTEKLSDKKESFKSFLIEIMNNKEDANAKLLVEIFKLLYNVNPSIKYVNFNVTNVMYMAFKPNSTIGFTLRKVFNNTKSYCTKQECPTYKVEDIDIYRIKTYGGNLEYLMLRLLDDFLYGGIGKEAYNAMAEVFNTKALSAGKPPKRSYVKRSTKSNTNTIDKKTKAKKQVKSAEKKTPRMKPQTKKND